MKQKTVTKTTTQLREDDTYPGKTCDCANCERKRDLIGESRVTPEVELIDFGSRVVLQPAQNPAQARRAQARHKERQEIKRAAKERSKTRIAPRTQQRIANREERELIEARRKLREFVAKTPKRARDALGNEI